MNSFINTSSHGVVAIPCTNDKIEILIVQRFKVIAAINQSGHGDANLHSVGGFVEGNVD